MDLRTQEGILWASKLSNPIFMLYTIQNGLILSQKYSDFAPKQWAGDLMTQQKLM